MVRRTARVRGMWQLRALFVASVAFALGSCTNGGTPPTVLFIGTNGTGSCFETIVVLDLEAAGARVSRTRDEHPDCRIDALLEASGCDARFVESNDRDELRIVVDSCSVPATTSLASCAFFLEGETNLTPFVTSSQCSCTGEQCLDILGVCVGEDDDPGACEHCTNQIDDDGNGQADCADANCAADPACMDVTTTTSTTSTSNSFVVSTPTTDPSTTTTSEIQDLRECRLTFQLPGDELVGALLWDTEILNPHGRFVTSEDRADCTVIEPALSAFNMTSETTLRSGLISVEGIQGPADLAECRYRTRVPGSDPIAADFEVIVSDASDPTSNAIEPFPDVVLSIGECFDIPPD
jgi:hypothetical protein